MLASANVIRTEGHMDERIRWHNLDLMPHFIACPDCSSMFSTWAELERHWRHVYAMPGRWPKHFTPRKRPVEEP